MKTHRIPHSRRGFTLMELMVAMAITTIIVTVLVSITSMALDTWNRSRAEVRAARQAKAMVDTMARDLESLVTRRGGSNEWLSALYGPSKIEDQEKGPTNLKSTNSAELIFFTSPTDRYNGAIGNSAKDKGGDVSCVGYTLKWKDPINEGSASNAKNKTFVLNRYLANPDVTFANLIGKPPLSTAFSSYQTELDKNNNFVCENIFQFSMTFHVEVTPTASDNQTVIQVPITLGDTDAKYTTKQFTLTGAGIINDSTGQTNATPEQIKAGRLRAVEISLTVLSDAGVEQLRSGRSLDSAEKKSEFMTKNSFQFSKLVQLPGM